MSFVKIFLQTPWWVYLLLIYLIQVGIKARKTRVVSIKKIFVVPSIFFYLSLYTLFKTININIFSLTTWTASILSGTALGWWQISRHKLAVDRYNGLLRIPGTWSTLLLILLIFVTKYYFNYTLTLNPWLAEKTEFAFSILVVSGICTGLFIGRFVCFLYRFYTEVSVNLKTEDY